ncbi:hypothetical protein [Bacillus toyonensis]|uniref:hypothetical protein n=1 Tax=Bacillus toyonensis TaxID=155322 RepID=UPI0018A15AB1|nr:hypothetical protein [Bacillus toyonensis]MBF7150029.1 hypothetical protein [Bacillus toyonensis]MEC2351347.1 hypothetical protein [Bacillus toyonensis]MED3189683.1 hypothetical protein [Bacillus toyonensis]
MIQIKTIEIQCTYCKFWFPSPIFFDNMNSFDTSILIGNTVSCPSCGKMVSCNKENMRIRYKNAEFKGNQTN